METIAFSGPFTLDRSRHAAVQVYEYLREEIVNLTLKPGTLLSRNELSAHFELSVTPIRDALMRLEEEGLVDIYPQHATRVRGISIASARQAHFLRLSIELEVVRTLAQKNDAALGQLLQSLVMQQRRRRRSRGGAAAPPVGHALRTRRAARAVPELLDAGNGLIRYSSPKPSSRNWPSWSISADTSRLSFSCLKR